MKNPLPFLFFVGVGEGLACCVIMSPFFRIQQSRTLRGGSRGRFRSALTPTHLRTNYRLTLMMADVYTLLWTRPKISREPRAAPLVTPNACIAVHFQGMQVLGDSYVHKSSALPVSCARSQRPHSCCSFKPARGHHYYVSWAVHANGYWCALRGYRCLPLAVYFVC